MERLQLEENEAACQRLAALIDTLGDERLQDVATELGAMAFWDRWAQTLIHRWRSGELPPPTVPSWYDDAINRTLLPTWQALPGAVAARLAVTAAQDADLEIRRAETPVIAGILAAG